MNGIIVNDGKDRLRDDVLLGMTSSTNGSGLTPYRLKRGALRPATELQEG